MMFVELLCRKRPLWSEAGSAFPPGIPAPRRIPHSQVAPLFRRLFFALLSALPGLAQQTIPSRCSRYHFSSPRALFARVFA